MTTASTATRAPSPSGIVVRTPTFELDDLPQDWVGGSRWGTAFGNAGHVFVPLGEQFFIDTVRLFRDRVDDPDQRRDVNAFIGQEAVHARAHRQVWDAMEAWGVPVATYGTLIERFRGLERVLPAPFRLSVTAALEHWTAAFGHAFLTEDLHTVVPEEMARLLAWHGLEELEHRSVAFDVLAEVDDSPALRVAGFVFASGLLVVVPAVGTVLFAAADLRRRGWRPPPTASRRPGLGRMSARFARTLGGHLGAYLRPGFHPRDMEPPPEAQEWSTAMS